MNTQTMQGTGGERDWGKNFAKTDPTFDSKNKKLLISFVEYAYAHSELRFWQALRNWAGVNYLFTSEDGKVLSDTFNWSNKND